MNFGALYFQTNSDGRSSHQKKYEDMKDGFGSVEDDFSRLRSAAIGVVPLDFPAPGQHLRSTLISP